MLNRRFVRNLSFECLANLEEAIALFVVQYSLLFVHPFKRNTARTAA